MANLHIVTHVLQQLLDPQQAVGDIAVMIDILRASSTMTTALANGAKAVIPCETIEQALSLKETSYPDGLLGGERGGIRIEGFDLSNSPADYSAEVVAEKPILFTTTNGTKALQRCRLAREVLIGCFLNRAALVAHLANQQGTVHLVCAGTDGELTLEDCLFAGAVTQALLEGGDADCDDASRLCLSLYQRAAESPEGILEQMLVSQGGRNLTRLQMQPDVQTCSRLDQLDLVPAWNIAANQITPLNLG